MNKYLKCVRCEKAVATLVRVSEQAFVCCACFDDLDRQGDRRMRLDGRSWWPRAVFEAEVAGDTEPVPAWEVSAALTAKKPPSVAPMTIETTQQRARITKCHFCGEPIASLRDWIILDHPDRSLPSAFLSHLACGLIHERARSGNADADLLGYGILLKRIVQRGNDSRPHASQGDTLLGWLAHLRRKTWFLPSMQSVIEDGHAIASKAKGGQANVRKSIPLRVRHELLERARGKCSLCGVHSSEAVLHIDHVVPVSAGGTNAQDNLRVLCAPCNLGKGARPVLHLLASA